MAPPKRDILPYLSPLKANMHERKRQASCTRKAVRHKLRRRLPAALQRRQVKRSPLGSSQRVLSRRQAQ